MRHTQLINYMLYQIGWFACVLGAASQRPWTGCLIALILVGVHLALTVERSIEVRLVALAIAVGAVVEMTQIAAGTYRFTSGTVTDALPPPWLLAMRAQVATTFRLCVRGDRPVCPASGFSVRTRAAEMRSCCAWQDSTGQGGYRDRPTSPRADRLPVLPMRT